MGQMKIRGNTQIIAGSIGNTEISATAAIASSKLADGANFIKKDGTVAMTAALTLSADPTSAMHAATKQYVDNFSTGVWWKQSVRVATTANITLSGTQTIDGVALSAGDRVLVKNQSTGSANGIYTVAAGAWARTTDADATAEVKAGLSVWVNEGTANGDSQWLLTTNDTITLGTTALVFTQVSGLGQISPGWNLSKSGNTLNVLNDPIFNTVKFNDTQVDCGYLRADTNLGITSDNAFTVLSQSAGQNSNTGFHIAHWGGMHSMIVMPVMTSGRTMNLQDKDGTFAFVTDFVNEEVPTGTINGSNTAFTLANTVVAGSVILYLNGIRLRSGAGNDFTISGSAITMLYAPQTGDLLIATYMK